MPLWERKYISAALILIAACFFLIPPRVFVPVRSHFVSAISPVEQPLQMGLGSIGNSFSRIKYLWNVEEENTELVVRMQELLAENRILEEENFALRRRQGQLDEFNEQYQNIKKKPVFAQILHRDIGHLRSEIHIDKGSNQGIKEGCAVLYKKSVVGRVTEVGPRTSKVRLLWDPKCSILVKVARDTATGIVSGNGFETASLKLEYYPRGGKIQVGDSVFTTGFENFFEPNLLVGEVIEAREAKNSLFTKVVVKPLVDFDLISEVIVLLPD